MLLQSLNSPWWLVVVCFMFNLNYVVEKGWVWSSIAFLPLLRDLCGLWLGCWCFLRCGCFLKLDLVSVKAQGALPVSKLQKKSVIYVLSSCELPFLGFEAWEFRNVISLASNSWKPIDFVYGDALIALRSEEVLDMPYNLWLLILACNASILWKLAAYLIQLIFTSSLEHISLWLRPFLSKASTFSFPWHALSTSSSPSALVVFA